MGALARHQERPVAHAWRGGGKRPAPAIAADAQPRDRAIQRVDIANLRRARGRKITLFGGIEPLLKLHRPHELRDQEVDVRISLPVGMAWEIDGNTRDRRCEVGSVIEIEAAKVVLIRLALAAVLTDHEAWDGLEHFSSPHD